MYNDKLSKYMNSTNREMNFDSNSIFTISYASNQVTPKRASFDRSNKKLITNKIGNTSNTEPTSKTDNVTRWKLKTLDKLASLNDTMPCKQIIKSPSKQTKQSHSLQAQIKRRSKTREHQNHNNLINIQSRLNEQIMASSIVKQKFYQSPNNNKYKNTYLHNGTKCFYLQYKQNQKSNRTKKFITSNSKQRQFSAYQSPRNSKSYLNLDQQQQFVNNQQNPTIQTMPQNHSISPKKRSKNVTFIQTVQYLPVSKQQLRHLKARQKETPKISSVGKTQSKFRKSHNVTNLNENSHNQTDYDNIGSNQSIFNRNRPIRTNHTEKRLKHILGSVMDNPDTYRPWSPLKTNPRHLMEGQEDMLYQRIRQNENFSILSKLH